MVDISSSHDAAWVHRYGVVVRTAHWINLACVAVLVMSGLQIFNAHPALYWGEASDFSRPLLSIHTMTLTDGRTIGVTSVLGQRLDTTGLLGRSQYRGRPAHRAFPAWATIPSGQDLATGRVWHFFFAWVFVVTGGVYTVHGLATGRFARELVPGRGDLRRIGGTLRDHARLRFHRASGGRYNVLQQLAYLLVLFALGPLVLVTGLAMSPGVTAAAPWLLDLFGGRQSARTMHFVATWLFLLFALLHVFMVAVSGFVPNMRSMTTGWFPAGDRGRQ